jgi:CRP-like cAMP-binding protein
MSQSRRAGEWLIKEGEVSRKNIYKLLRGAVSIYEGGKKRASIEVKEGAEPRLIGVLAALSSDGGRTASVGTDTEIKFETISIDHIKNILEKDIPQHIKEDIDTAIKAIVLRDEVNRLLDKLSKLSLAKKLEIPENVDPEVEEVLSELKKMHESSL